MHITNDFVALLAEGVDRNHSLLCRGVPRRCVALLAEGVDRNPCLPIRCPTPTPSPSSRRAWIEICNTWNRLDADRVALLAEGVDRNIRCRFFCRACHVALLAEGVDRNVHRRPGDTTNSMSPSSRRAWIEMRTVWRFLSWLVRSPSSRRAWIEITRSDAAGVFGGRRPPRGGRG